MHPRSPAFPHCVLLGILSLALTPAVGRSEVVGVEVTTRTKVLDSRPWGRAGAYEKLVGRIEFAVDPASPFNDVIVDLGRAPLGADGKVHATADLMVLQPVDPSRRSGTALLEVSNRGRKAALAYFQKAEGSADPSEPGHFGDGLLMRRGMTLIWVGWQVDVPRQPDLMRLEAPIAQADGQALEGLVRCDWTLDAPAQRLELGHRGHVPYPLAARDHPDHRLTVRDGRMGERREVPRSSWSFDEAGTAIESAAGFEPGHIYELVYRARDPWVVGLGLVAVRDTMSYAKNDRDCAFKVARGVAVGISQTGRFLRHFLWQGLNTDEFGHKVFDGVMVHSAGAGRGSFNHRFAQPSRDAHRYSAFFYPTDLFPFTGRIQRDAAGDRSDGLLALLLAREHAPRVFYTNTGYEYWGRAASLVHTSLEGSADVEPLENERIYHLASGQHFVVPFPPGEDTRLEGSDVYTENPLDFSVTLRALMVALIEWVEVDREPPPSAYPRIDEDTLVAIGHVGFPEVPGLRLPTVAHEAHRIDYGEGWREGVVTQQPPAVGEAYPALVPQLDEVGNELGGLPALELLDPLATYFPWCLRTGLGAAEDELRDFYGTFVPLPRTEEERMRSGDSRPSLEAMYGDRDRYLTLVEASSRDLVDARLLLPQDVDRTLVNAAAAWDWVHAR